MSFGAVCCECIAGECKDEGEGSDGFLLGCNMCLAIVRSALANLDLLTPGGDTTLHMAVAVCSTPVVHALVVAGANLDIMDAKGCTALHMAVYSSCEERNSDAEDRACHIINGKEAAPR